MAIDEATGNVIPDEIQPAGRRTCMIVDWFYLGVQEYNTKYGIKHYPTGYFVVYTTDGHYVFLRVNISTSAKSRYVKYITAMLGEFPKGGLKQTDMIGTKFEAKLVHNPNPNDPMKPYVNIDDVTHFNDELTDDIEFPKDYDREKFKPRPKG